MLIPDKEKVKLVSTEKRKADDVEQIKDLKKVNIFRVYQFRFVWNEREKRVRKKWQKKKSEDKKKCGIVLKSEEIVMHNIFFVLFCLFLLSFYFPSHVKKIDFLYFVIIFRISYIHIVHTLHIRLSRGH